MSGREAVFGRLTSGGGLDAAFGVNGVAVVDLLYSDVEIADVAVQPDGRIFAVGRMGVPGNRGIGMMIRLLADGGADPSFDGDGVLTGFDVGGGSLLGPNTMTGVTLDQNGDPLVAGELFANDRSPNGQFVARLPAAGQERPLLRITEPPGYESGRADPALLGDGRVVLAGSARRGFLLSIFSPGLRPLGSRTADVAPGGDIAAAIATDDRDGVVVAGRVVQSGGESVGLVRFAGPRLQLDRSFGRNGRTVVATPAREWARAVAVLPDGRLLAMAGGPGDPDRPSRIVLMRFHGGYDRSRPTIRLSGLPPRCASGAFRLRIRVRDQSPLSVTVSLDGRRLRTSTRRSFTVRVPLRERRQRPSHRLQVEARDVADNSRAISRRFARCG
jgi:hypothetical protein